MNKVAFITGILGQDGAYLARFLIDKGYKVHGLHKAGKPADKSKLEYMGVKGGVNLIAGDISDERFIRQTIALLKPDEIYNLAGQSVVYPPPNEYATTLHVNSSGVLHMLNAIKDTSPKTRFFQASSSEMFGENGRKFQVEEGPFYPRTFYGVSKLSAHAIVDFFRNQHGIMAVNGILFNHESPLRDHYFVTRKITDGVSKIALGLSKALTLQTLNSERDWGFAGDYVRAMFMVMKNKKLENYIIASGETHSLREFLDIAFSHVGIKNWSKYIKLDTSFKRSFNQPVRTKAQKIKNELKWQPTVAFPVLVKMMVDADIKRMQSNHE